MSNSCCFFTTISCFLLYSATCLSRSFSSFPVLLSSSLSFCSLSLIIFSAPLGVDVVGPKAVGTALFTHYLLLVEVAAMLLLAALVAAYHLGKREPSADEDKQ